MTSGKAPRTGEARGAGDDAPIRQRWSSRYTKHVTVTLAECWRAPTWPDSIPSRNAWFATCDLCGPLGEGWGYGLGRSARGVATNHEKRVHGGAS